VTVQLDSHNQIAELFLIGDGRQVKCSENGKVLNYILMFYEFLMLRSKAGMLPPVLPILIYNGRRNWNVPFKLEELIEPYLPERYIPHFEYYPIIEKNYSYESLFEIKI